MSKHNIYKNLEAVREWKQGGSYLPSLKFWEDKHVDLGDFLLQSSSNS